MSATDELRRMLDERGVKWADLFDESMMHTVWNGAECWFTEFPDGWTGLCVSKRCTPAQAVEATLGPETCKMVIDNHHRVDKVTTSWGCVCSACGGFHKFTHGEGWAYCPSCGRQVIGG